MARCKNGFHKSRRKLDKGTCISRNTVKRKRCANGSRKVGSTCQPNGFKTKTNQPRLSSPLREDKADSFYDSDDDMTPAELAAKRRRPSPEPMPSPPREPDPPKQIEHNITKIAKNKKGSSKSKQLKKTKKVVTKDGRIYKRGRRVKSKEKLWQPT
jgi:hypothetical protein